jgi:hypothetical protein
MNVLFRLTQLHMCNSFFFKVVNVPNMDALNHLEINRAWMWYPKLGITKWYKSKMDIPKFPQCTTRNDPNDTVRHPSKLHPIAMDQSQLHGMI